MIRVPVLRCHTAKNGHAANQGFDSAFYIKRSNNQTDELWRGDQLAEKPFDNRLLSETFTREAVKFINEGGIGEAVRCECWGT